MSHGRFGLGGKWQSTGAADGGWIFAGSRVSVKVFSLFSSTSLNMLLLKDMSRLLKSGTEDRMMKSLIASMSMVGLSLGKIFGQSTSCSSKS